MEIVVRSFEEGNKHCDTYDEKEHHEESIVG